MAIQSERSAYAPPSAELAEPESHAAAFYGYAGFWKRFAAHVLDVVILMFLVLPLAIVLGLALGAAGTADSGTEAIGNLFGIVAVLFYYALQESSRHQATLGKRALGIIVTDLDGRPIGFGRACGRHVASVLNYLTLYIGWIMAGLTERKQGLHDMLAGTLVVNKTEAGPIPAWAVVVLVIVFGSVPMLGILAAIAIPAYADFTQRARVSEALMDAAPAKIAVAEWYQTHEALPESLEAAGLERAPLGKHVRQLEFRDGLIVVTLAMPKSALDGQTVALEPYWMAESQYVAWRCGRAPAPAGGSDIAPGDSAAETSIEEQYAPSACRPPRR